MQSTSSQGLLYSLRALRVRIGFLFRFLHFNFGWYPAQLGGMTAPTSLRQSARAFFSSAAFAGISSAKSFVSPFWFFF